MGDFWYDFYFRFVVFEIWMFVFCECDEDIVLFVEYFLGLIVE